MTNNCRSWLWLSLLTGCVALAGCNPSSSGGDDPGEVVVEDPVDPNAPLVRARLPDRSIGPGDTFEIEISFDNFPPTEGGGISLQFDPALLRVNRVDFGADWNFVIDPGVIDNAAGEVRDILFSSFDHPGGASLIATLNVTALANGSGDIRLAESTRNPFAGSGSRIRIRFLDAEVAVE